jgi:hypothetical protein
MAWDAVPATDAVQAPATGAVQVPATGAVLGRGSDVGLGRGSDVGLGRESDAGLGRDEDWARDAANCRGYTTVGARWATRRGSANCTKGHGRSAAD